MRYAMFSYRESGIRASVLSVVEGPPLTPCFAHVRKYGRLDGGQGESNFSGSMFLGAASKGNLVEYEQLSLNHSRKARARSAFSSDERPSPVLLGMARSITCRANIRSAFEAREYGLQTRTSNA